MPTRHRATSHLLRVSLVFMTLGFIFSACTASSPTEATLQATATQPLPTASPVPPSPTLRPTKVPIPTVTPTPELSPEVRATSVEQVVGKWTMYLAGGGEGDPAVLTLAADGTFSMDAIGGYHKGMNLGFGTFRFEDDNLVLESDNCDGISGIFTCTATYRVYLSMVGDEPGALRFTVIDDPHIDRKDSLNKKILFAFVE